MTLCVGIVESYHSPKQDVTGQMDSLQDFHLAQRFSQLFR